MTYKDRTWCSLWESCKNGYKCDRAFTLEHQLAARKWWGQDNAPVSFMEFPCYVKDD